MFIIDSSFTKFHKFLYCSSNIFKLVFIVQEIFQSIVQAFENLDDMSSRSYSKRVSVLETVAKVRLCVVMLDLECDTLILEMFRHFLKVIR